VVFVLAKVLVEIIDPAVHGEATPREQFPRHDRGIGVTEVCHHVRLLV